MYAEFLKIPGEMSSCEDEGTAALVPLKTAIKVLKSFMRMQKRTLQAVLLVWDLPLYYSNTFRCWKQKKKREETVKVVGIVGADVTLYSFPTFFFLLF